MKPTRPLLLVIAVVVAFLVAAAVGVGYSGTNAWAAVVDEQEIDEREFLRELDQIASNAGLAEFLPALEENAGGAVPADLAAAWLGRLIQQELIDAEMERRGDVEVTDEHREQARQLSMQQFQGEQVFAAFDEWFQERLVERDARFLAMIEEIGGTPTEAELREEFEANEAQVPVACASHILVETQEQAQALKEQIEAGAAFADVAAAESLDFQSGSQGGNLGCSPQGSFVEPFEEVVWSIEPGVVSDPVETQFGWHLIMVERRGAPTFEESRAQIEQRLQSSAQQRFGDFLFDLLDRAEVTVNPKYGDFETSPAGPQVVPPSAPEPPSGLPVDGEPDAPGGSFDPFQPVG